MDYWYCMRWYLMRAFGAGSIKARISNNIKVFHLTPQMGGKTTEDQSYPSSVPPSRSWTLVHNMTQDVPQSHPQPAECTKLMETPQQCYFPITPAGRPSFQLCWLMRRVCFDLIWSDEGLLYYSPFRCCLLPGCSSRQQYWRPSPYIQYQPCLPS